MFMSRVVVRRDVRPLPRRPSIEALEGRQLGSTVPAIEVGSPPAQYAIVGNHIGVAGIQGNHIGVADIQGNHIGFNMIVGKHIGSNMVVGNHIGTNAVVGKPSIIVLE